MRRGDFEKFLENMRQNWGDTAEFLSERAPSVCEDPAEQAFLSRLLVQSGSPGTAGNITRLNYELDIRPILSAVHVPALVLHSRGDRTVSLEEAEYIADTLPCGCLKLLEREDHLPRIGDVDEVADEIATFVGAPESTAFGDRILATIVMTDIVGLTKAAEQMGDGRWRELIDAHDTTAARIIARHGGNLVKIMGGGVLTTFPGPSRLLCTRTSVRNVKTGAYSARWCSHRRMRASRSGCFRHRGQYGSPDPRYYAGRIVPCVIYCSRIDCWLGFGVQTS